MKKMFLTFAITATALLSSSVGQAKNNAEVGAVLGGVVGAAIGSEMGGGFRTLVGAIAGATIGATVGDRMDEEDRKKMAEAQSYSLEQAEKYHEWQDNVWDGPNYFGRFSLDRRGYYQSYRCYRYKNTITRRDNGFREIRSGTTCFGQNGWYEEYSSNVTWY